MTFWQWLKCQLPILAYIFLAGTIAFTISQQRSETNKRRETLAASSRVVIMEGCERDNSTRKALIAILQAGEVAALRNIRERDGSEVEKERASKFYRDAYARLQPIDCREAAKKIKTE